MDLLLWYNAAKRDLPWRRTRDPYAIWISEIMLQQTRVEAVKGYYERFLRELPTVRDLAACPDDQLLKLWEGLGYYSRARNMKRAAGIIVQEGNGAFPRSREELLKLPGIGSYTAGAIASIAFGEPEPAVDGNVLRVYARLTASRENILAAGFKKVVEGEIRELLGQSPQSRPGDVNQAFIELGATVCGPNGPPRCAECPLERFCEAHRLGIAEELPVRIKKTERRVEDLTVLLVRDGDTTAVRKRPEKGLLAGLYEFPNLPGHASEKTALDYVEGQGLTPLQIHPLPEAKHVFSHVEWHMSGYEIRVAALSSRDQNWIFARNDEIEKGHAIPSAFAAYAKHLTLHLGKTAEGSQ